jgi:uncharacterized membrane protein
MVDNNPDPGWYFCTKHNTVEHGNVCRAADRLGPYPDKETASRALDIAKERSAAWDKAEREWDDN